MHHGGLKVALGVHAWIEVDTQLALLHDIHVGGTTKSIGVICSLLRRLQGLIDAVQVLQIVSAFLVPVYLTLLPFHQL